MFDNTSGDLRIIGTTYSTSLYSTGVVGGSDVFNVHYVNGDLTSPSGFVINSSGAQADIWAAALDETNGYIVFGGTMTSTIAGLGCAGSNNAGYIARISFSSPNLPDQCQPIISGGGGAVNGVTAITTDLSGNTYATGIATGNPGTNVDAGSGTDADIHIWKLNSSWSVTSQFRKNTSTVDNAMSILWQNGLLFVAGDTNGLLYSTYISGGVNTDYFVMSIDDTLTPASDIGHQFGSAGTSSFGLALIGDSGLGEVSVIGASGAALFGGTKSSSAVSDVFIETMDESTLSPISSYEFDDTNIYENTANSASVYILPQSAIMSSNGFEIWLSGKAVNGDTFGTYQGGTSDAFLFMMTAP